LEGDVVAERFEVADVLTLTAFDAEPIGVEVHAEVKEVDVRWAAQLGSLEVIIREFAMITRCGFPPRWAGRWSQWVGCHGRRTR
jgi:hypothetical protein